MPTQEIPNEVVERFDSLDIDSSELIQDLDLNSNTILTLMMDTSSGLSISDSFSDITNSNHNNTLSYNNTSTNNNNSNNSGRTKLKLNVSNTNTNTLANNCNDNNIVSELLDTPTIELTNVSFGAHCADDVGLNDPLLSVLDLDNNNRLN